MDAKRIQYRLLRRVSFNPRARDGREMTRYNIIFIIYVSIHAPVMDANSPNRQHLLAYQVSIHAPVMDANKSIAEMATKKISFNPRARDGRE